MRRHNYKHLVNGILFFIILSFYLYSCSNNSPRIDSPVIPVIADQLINETALGNAGLLVDEQVSQTIDFLKTPKTFWAPGAKPWFYPVSVVFDLHSITKVQECFIFVDGNIADVVLSTGIPFKWKLFQKPWESRSGNWYSLKLDLQTQYLQLKVNGKVQIGEILFTGLSTNPVNKPKTIVPAFKNSSYPEVDELIGVNCLVDDPLNELTCVTWMREYHPWLWDEGNQSDFKSGDDGSYLGFPNNKNRFSPSYPGWKFDEFYRNAKNQGMLVSPVITGSTDWISDKIGNKPGQESFDLQSPETYEAHADHLFQFAARYGKVKVQDTLLKLDTGQARISGLDLISGIENWNEEDAWWDGRKSYFTPYEFAAMSSADYDGHLGKMGKTFGVKNADPSLPMIFGGLAYLNTDYMKAVKFWSLHFRGGNVPFDILNFHHYSNTDPVENKKAISPEEDELKLKIRRLVSFAKGNFPGKKIWLTEFGYDVESGSPQGVPQIGMKASEEVQADWIVRSYLELAGSGIDAAFLYMFRDVTSGNASKYATSGLTIDQHHQQRRKISWFYVMTLKNTLKGFRFVQEERCAGVRLYRFRNNAGKEGFAVWLPTSEGKSINNFVLSFRKEYEQCRIISFAKDSTNGTTQNKKLQQGNVLLKLSETPLFVFPE